MKKQLILLVMEILAIGAFARDFTYCDLTYSVIDEESATCKTRAGYYIVEDWDGPHTVFEGNHASGELIIPETVYDESGKAFTVTEIGSYGFLWSRALTKVKLPETIKIIGESAFEGCYSLEYITIPDHVTTIEGSAFCLSGLKSISLPNSVVEIGGSAFECPLLTSITIPSNIQKLGRCIIGGYISEVVHVYYEADVLLEADYNTFYDLTYQTATLYVKESALEQARTVQPWCSFVNIQPYDFSGVEEVSAEVVSTKYFNLQGIEVAPAFKGLVVKVETLANGRKLTSKTILK